MPDYNLGRAHGTIKIDYDGSGAEDAREDIQDVGDEATKSSEKIDKSTKESKEDFEALAQSAKKASESLQFDNTSAEQMAATVNKLEKDVTDASSTAYAARARLTAAEQQLNEVRNRSGVTAKEIADAEAAVRRAQQQTVTSTQKLENNTRALSVARERLNRIPKPPDPTPDVDNNVLQQFIRNLQQIQSNTAKNASILNTFSGRLRLVVGGVAVLAPGIAGLAVSLASLAGLAGVAAGALAGLGAVAATVGTGMSGIGGAFKAASTQAKAAGSSAAASAKAQRAAARAIEDAKRSLADAEENLRRTQEDAARAVAQALRAVMDAQRDLAEAQRDALRAQESLNRARQQAVRDLEDMQFALRGGSLDERQAILDVKEAQEELNKVLADPTANADDIEQARINYEQMVLALDEARKANERLKVDSQAAAAAGVEGSDAVVNAQDGVRSATQAVADAQQALADAQENVKQVQIDSARQVSDAVQSVIDAQRNLAEAYADAADAGAAGGGAADKFAEAMAKLSPNARAFVQEVLNLKDAWDAVRRSVQDKLFEGLAAEVQPLAQKWFPLLEDGMGKVATALNGIVKETVAYLHTAEAQQNVQNIFNNTGAALSNLRGIVRDLLAAFLDIASVGSDFLPSMATDAANAAARFREFISAAKDSGQLRQWMQEAMDTASQLWQLLKNLGSIIGTVFSAIDQQGGGALNTLTNITGQVAEFLKSAKGQEALTALGRALAAIGGAVGSVFLSFLEVAADLLVGIEPLVTAFADAVGPYLSGVIQTFGAVLQPVADLLGFLGPALGPVVAGIYAANKAVDAAILVWRGLNIVMNANPFLVIAAAIITLVILIVQNWDSIAAFLSDIWTWIKDLAVTVWTAISDFFVGLWNTITTAISTAWNAIGDFFKNTWNSISNGIKNAWNAIGDFFESTWDKLSSGVKDVVTKVVNFFRELPGKIVDFIKGLPQKFLDLGRDIVSGILRGLGNLASAIWKKLKDAISSAWDSVLDFFGISSPSKLAAEAGENIVAGLVRGIDNSTSSAVRAAATMAQAVGNELTGASGTLALQADLAAKGSVLTDPLAGGSVLATAPAATAVTRGGDGATAGRTIIIERVDVHVQGNLDPTNPTAFRRTMVRLKDELRNLDKEYA
jgi:phage-related protein